MRASCSGPRQWDGLSQGAVVWGGHQGACPTSLFTTPHMRERETETAVVWGRQTSGEATSPSFTLTVRERAVIWGGECMSSAFLSCAKHLRELECEISTKSRASNPFIRHTFERELSCEVDTMVLALHLFPPPFTSEIAVLWGMHKFLQSLHFLTNYPSPCSATTCFIQMPGAEVLGQ